METTSTKQQLSHITVQHAFATNSVECLLTTQQLDKVIKVATSKSVDAIKKTLLGMQKLYNDDATEIAKLLYCIANSEIKDGSVAKHNPDLTYKVQ